MRKMISAALSLSMLCTSITGISIARAEDELSVENAYFTHQNVVGSQTCYADDTDEKRITEIPDVVQGMRINQPVFRAYLGAAAAGKMFNVKQELKDGTVIQSDSITASSEGVLEFKHARNCGMVEIFYNDTVVASLGTDTEYVNGAAILSGPMSYQIYQRDENNETQITIKGAVSDAERVTVEISDTAENADIVNGEFTYTKTLNSGLYDITVSTEQGTVAQYSQVGVGDVWVAAGQSNMTDMGAITDDFDPDNDGPINENMHIMYAEDCKWQQMSHPAGEGRFFKAGVRTSPVTAFAREISNSENVPVGIVQSSVGGTNIYQWITGVRDSDANSGYLFNALKSCFDKMPSHNVKGILWYQGCNDAINENYAYSYKNLQQKLFDAMRGFFGNVPIITTQINDANQDSTGSLGYYDAWSFVKDVQRQNEELYDNVYVVGTGEQELGDTIHNNAASNVKLGEKWARAAKNVAYGDSSVSFRQPTIENAVVTGENEVTITFKNTNGLKKATGTKRLGITNVSGGGHKIELGDLAKEFVVRSNASAVVTASNSAKGDEMTITSAEIVDGNKVVLNTAEKLSGYVAVDCMYGKRFVPTLVDADTDESVLSFYNVMADLNDIIEPPAGFANQFGSEYNEIKAFNTSSLEETAIGDTGFKVSTSSSNYNNVVVMDNATKASNSGYYPYGNGLEDKGYYLFIGAGGNSNVNATLTLPTTAKAGEYVEITYAKPKATNNGSINRSAGNANTVTIGSKTIDVEGTSEYDTWYTKTVPVTDAVSQLDITLGKWSAIAILSVNIVDTAPTEDPTEAPTAAPTPVPGEDITYTFGNAYSVVKDFKNSAISDTDIGSTGFKVSTTSTNYSNVVIRNKQSANSGYYPYGSGLPENGYYLFMGAGGNSSVNWELTLPKTAENGKYMRITYAKPYATNNGSANRNSDNSADDKITVGGEVIDLKAKCEFDTWYTSTVKLNSDVSKLDITHGKWGAIAISKIEIISSADTMELTAEESSMYITDKNRTVQFNANVYNSITTLMGGTDIVTKGSVDSTAKAEYSVNGYSGVSIDESGLLTITPQATEGTVTVTATYGDVTKTAKLELKKVSDADGVKIVGSKLASKGGTVTLKAIPTASGTVIPECDTVWSIEGDAKGCTIENGVITVPANAQSGNITVKAVLAVVGSQTTTNVSDTITITIHDDSVVSPYSVKGIFLKNCIADVATANGIDGVVIDTDKIQNGYSVAVEALDENGIVIAENTTALSEMTEGVAEVKAPMEFKGAVKVNAYIINADKEIVSDKIYETAKTAYKNIPLVADWITGEKSGLGMGKGILAPVNAPYGVDPAVVDVADLNVKYTYDSNYPEIKTDNMLWYKTGAYLANSGNNNNSIYAMHGADWEEKALPIGNGYMGGMLFGLPDKDQIQINEETFWAAGYRGVQSSVASNNVNKNMSEGINGYMSVGNIFVDFNMPKGASVNNYYRDLNLDESVAHVQYEYNGVKYNREYFASYPKEVLVFHYTADAENALTFDVNPVSMHPGNVTVKDGEITIIGKLKDSEPYASGGNAAWNQKSDLEYCTKIKVIANGGRVTDNYNSVGVSGANDVTIIIVAATDYDKDQFELNSDGSVNMAKTPYKSTRGAQAAIEKAENRMNGAAAMTYDELKAEHIADYKSQFDTVKFSLTGDTVCQTPTDELQKSYNSVIKTATVDGKTNVAYTEDAYKALDKHLEELHYNYARYMMISSSRSTTMPATLQGKWCQSTAEIWGSCYCININMEMNYWFAGGANLIDSTKSLIGWFNSQIPAGKVTARNYYGVTPKSYKYENGKITFTDSTAAKDDVFIMHTKQAIMGTTDLTGSTSIQSAGNTAWLMYNLWDLYQTTGDKLLLENDIYPIMRQCANFYTQYLYTNERKTTTDTEKYPDGYYYTTWEGRSPEQGPTHEGIKYDLQLVAGMYDYTIAAAELLGVDANKVEAWKEIRNHMEAPVELGDEGQIKEWAEETTYNTDASGNALGDPVHRHISHLVGLYPGTLINRNTPDLLNGAKIVLTNRGDDSTGWSCSNKFLLWARTLEGDKALELFRYQLAKKTYANLFDTHAPFQIDGNFGSAAGVMELLMQSQTGTIYILPALPKVWDNGEISGIKAKNGAEISIKWENNEATEFSITPAVDGDITIGYGQENGSYTLNKSVKLDLSGDKTYTIKGAKAGETYTFAANGEVIDNPVKQSVELSKTSVKATGFDSGILVVAGYDDNMCMTKLQIVDGWEAELSDFDGCKTMKAFVWDSVENMKPLFGTKQIENK